MAEPRGHAEPWAGLRRATVLLVDPANPSVWGTGFFIARDVLLTCWHVVRDVAEQRVRVEQPAAGQGAASTLGWQSLGEATLLEAGKLWDLALLSFHPSSAGASGGEARPPVVLPLGEQDPPPGAQLLSSGFPEDAASRHDATYEAVGRTTPQGQSAEFLRLKADGVVPGVSGAALVEAASGTVCGVIARNELVGGASDGGLAVPIAVFRSAFPEHGETVLGRNKLECQERSAVIQQQLGRSDWNWPKAWDFSSYREEKRKDFVGRSWLFEDVRAWALNPDPQAPQALLIAADYGVGKSAFLAEMLATKTAGLPVAAHHFCTSEQEETLTPALFVRNLAMQLAHALPAYRQALEAEEAKEPRQWLDEAAQDPSRAFDQAILAPLLKVEPPSSTMLWVVDALDEAQEVRAGVRPGPQLTIVQLLARNASRLPRWIKVLATSRRRPDVLNPLRQAFSLQELDAEEARNLDDLTTYALERCRRSPLSERLEQAGLNSEDVARFLSAEEQSSGKFLYVVRVLNDLASGQLPLQSRKDLEQLPPGMDGFYRDAFERRFTSDASYALVRDILGVLCEQREPLGRCELAAILSVSEKEILEYLKPVHDLLRLVFCTDQINGEQRQIVLYGFDHFSLPQWLSEADEWGYDRAGRFMVDRVEAAKRIGRWARAEATNKQAHSWPYLVRHLVTYLTEEERPGLMAGLLGEFAWLESRLRQKGINVLLGDFALAAPSPWLGRLARVLRQGAHVLSDSGGWQGQEQLASQLLARLADEGAEARRLREQAVAWLDKTGGAPPLAASLVAQEALLRTLPVGSEVNALAVLPDGRLASGLDDCTIWLWDPTSGSCLAVCEGHQKRVMALAVLPDGRLASGSDDCTIRIWDPANGSCLVVLEGHQERVMALAVLPDGRLASGSLDKTIRLWDPASGSCSAVFEGHQERVMALAVLPDGRLASGSDDCTIRIWDPASGSCLAVLKGHRRSVNALVVLPDGRLASGSDDRTIRIWDPANGSCSNVLEGHKDWVMALAMLPDGRLASGSDDKTIRLWDPATGACERVFEGHQDWVRALAVFPDGGLSSGSNDMTIRLWDPAGGSCSNVLDGHPRVNSLAALPDGRIASGSHNNKFIQLWDPATGSRLAVFEGHEGYVSSLAVLPDGRLASGSVDQSIRLWDPASGSCLAVLQGSNDWVTALVELPDGGLASGSHDRTIRLWNPTSGSCVAVFEGHQSGVYALAVLPDGRLASGSYDNTIRIWDPASGSCSAVFEGHKDWVMALAMLPDGRLASGSDDRTIRLWDPTSGSCLAVFEGHRGGVNALAVLPDGHLASGSWDETIRIWDPASGSCLAVFEGHRGRVNALAVLPDGHLASGSWDETIRLWDPASGSCLAVFRWHRGGVMALAVLPDGRFASGSYDKTICIWDPANDDCLAELEGHRGSVNALVVLSDGRLASCSDDWTTRLWDPASGSCLGVFKGGGVSLAVLPDGRLASGSRSNNILLRNPASGSCSAVFKGHEDEVSALAVLPDGRVASGSYDKTIRIWDPAIGSCAAVFEGHQRGVYALAVLPDGRLASGSGDCTIRIWDPASGSCLAVLKGHREEVNALAVLPDGRLASCSRDCTIRLWDPASPDAGSQVIFVADAPIITIHAQPVSVQDSDIASSATTGTTCRDNVAPAMTKIGLWLPSGGFFGKWKWAIKQVKPIATQSISRSDPTPWIPHPTRPLLVAGDASGRLHCLKLQAPSRPTTG